MWIDPYQQLGLRCNPFIAEQIPGVPADLWLDRGFSQAPSPGTQTLVQLIGDKAAGKTSHLLHWQQQTGGSYAYYPPGWGRWKIPPVEAIAYWDEADRIPIPVLLGSLAYATRRQATIVVGTHVDLRWAAYWTGLKVQTIEFPVITFEEIKSWANRRIAAVQLPNVSSVELSLDTETLEEILAQSNNSWRTIATHLHIWVAKIANQS